MKKHLLPTLLVLAFLGLTAFIVLRKRQQLVVLASMHERTGPTAQLPEWPQVRANAQKLFLIVRDHPEDVKSALQLASLYIQEGRITGEFEYYNTAALSLIDGALAKQPKMMDALLLKATVQLSQHHFTDALQTAEQANQIQSFNAFLQGVFVDAYVELGQYDKAVAHCDEMMNIRPDMRSYSRVAYLRELHGDLPGAVDAMKMAVDAGTYGDEATGWSRIQLGRLYELIGQRDYAAMQYAIALRERPGYGHALAGQARLAADSSNFEQAISLAQEARRISASLDYDELLVEFYQAAGNKQKATEELSKMQDELTRARSAGEATPNHHADKELAWVYLQKGNYDKALQHAKAEYARRPDNIEVNELMAWCTYKAGDTRGALPFLQVASRTRYGHPAYLCRSGLILAAAGDMAKAREQITAALKNNPVIDASIRNEARKIVQP